MSAIKLQAFGGMIPAIDDRLLPDDASADAQNAWFYNGLIEGFRRPVVVLDPTDTGTRSVFRVPKSATDLKDIANSYWLQFQATDISVVKSPVTESADPAFYWADGIAPPGYTTLSRLAASQLALVLGIPSPAVAPTVGASGGTGATETRSYVYTWVSAYGEEGPPSPPTVHTGKIDDTWAIGLTAPTTPNTTNRDLTHTNIYRTVTSSAGVATFYFVTQLPIATLSYNDTKSDDVVVAGNALESTTFIAPPEDLEGLAVLPNGILSGWRANEIWFSEPYRPHAWNPAYQIATEYDIVAMVGAGQTLVIGTQGYPYYATGVSPASMTLQRLPEPQPCVSRGSMVGSQFGGYYASPNGLIFVSALGTVQNVTRDTISKQKWQTLLNLREVRAALLNGAYFAYCGVQEAAFDAGAFDGDSFQFADNTGTRLGALIEFQEKRVGFTRLLAPDTIFNILQDVWTGEVLGVNDGNVAVFDLNAPNTQPYTWLSKVFPLPMPDNLGAIKITYGPPIGDQSPSGVLTVFADGIQRFQRLIPASDQVFRMPSGYKANAYQFGITGNLIVKSVQIASTIKELQGV